MSSFVESGDDFSDVNVIVSTMGVVGDFQVHDPIGVTTVMMDTAMPAPTMAPTIEPSDVPMSSLLPQATPSTAGTARGTA